MTRDDYLGRYLINQREDALNKLAGAMADLSVANDAIASLQKRISELEAPAETPPKTE